MSDLAPSVQRLVDSTPINRVRIGVSTVEEITAYPDGHANIAVGSLDTSERRAMVYACADSLPLNHRDERERSITAVLDRLFEAAGREN